MGTSVSSYLPPSRCFADWLYNLADDIWQSSAMRLSCFLCLHGLSKMIFSCYTIEREHTFWNGGKTDGGVWKIWYKRRLGKDMRIGICDDEPLQRQYLEHLVKKWGKERQEAVMTASFDNGKSFLFQWQEDRSFDLLLLDIEMGDLNGMELARRLREEKEGLAIIFITGYTEYMGQGYEVQALHYLLKPVDEKKMFQVLDRALEQKEKNGVRHVFETSDGMVNLTLQEIWYVEAFAHISVLHMGGQTQWRIKKSIGDVERLLEEYGIAMVKPHRSYLVNLDHVTGIFREELQMDDGTMIPLSRRNRGSVHEAFVRHFRGGN